jgi:hypothetical protein
MGAILFVYGAVHGFLDFLRDVAFAAKHAGSVMDFLTAALSFLTTGGGNLLATVVGAGLILWTLRPRQTKIQPSSSAQQASSAKGSVSPPAADYYLPMAPYQTYRSIINSEEIPLDPMQGFRYERRERQKLQKRLAAHEKRSNLRRMLGGAYNEGQRLYLGQANREAIEKWESETHALIRAAFADDTHAQSFLHGDTGTHTGSQGTSEQALPPNRLDRLVRILIAADESELRSSFDPQDWTKRE